MRSKSLILKKDDGRVTYSKEPASIISTLANGTYTVTFSKYLDPRSIEQNALMWLWFTCIERETGTSRQDVHDYYCRMFLLRHITFNGEMTVVVGGTRNLTKDKMTEFLNAVQADAQVELGITLPKPEDKFFEDFFREYTE